MKNKIINYLTIIAILIFISGCTELKPEFPNDFAVYKKSPSLMAASYDGIMYRIKTEKNEPLADLSFWKTALKKRMMDSGYYFLSDSEIIAGNQKGYLLELSAPVGQQDFSYIISIFVTGSKILIVEASGPIGKVNSKKFDIISAIKKIKIESN